MVEEMVLARHAADEFPEDGPAVMKGFQAWGRRHMRVSFKIDR